MYPTNTLTEKSRLFLTILFPILVTQIGMYAMNFFDTVMSGRAGAKDLAGVAIGSSIWLPVFTGLNGILLAISPIVAQHMGANQRGHVSESVKQGIYLAIALAVFVFIVGAFVLDPILGLMNLSKEVEHVARYYLVALGLGIVPLFVFNLIRSFIDALGQTRISMFIILLSLPINAILNYLFIFGKFGMPALGGIGAGVASALTYFVCLLVSIIVLLKMTPFTTFHIFKKWKRPSIHSWWEQLRIGIPIGFAIFFETSIFAAVTLFLSKYDTATIAAHQAAMNFQSLLYMAPLSIAMALTIAVAFEIGGGRYQDAKQYSVIGIVTAISLAVIGGAIMVVFDGGIARLYSEETEVIQLIPHFLLYAVFFQLSDAIQAPIQGILRGYKDVNVTSIMAFISYWVIGLPLGIVLANYTDFGPFGYWIGLIAGLSAGALTLGLRLIFIQKKHKSLVTSS
ncbi:MATE family efflux transporter [Salinibacillus xinjiangensis]|uniref:Probable multidrug resistance protein NorM n=1 Tax=Salinibacillus xinjiangensis TaxID=1229268 RepID=A0A6G1X7I7_9BACI|nr:MATE family efflux transporter [Salinibacillus xinjiangensis]MRG86840.1 MATE family efflux transporter [Salinibacillus xinjiangensis]